MLFVKFLNFVVSVKGQIKEQLRKKLKKKRKIMDQKLSRRKNLSLWRSFSQRKKPRRKLAAK